ncbi:carbon-nitrogen hydrolase family protein [Candidatus Bathyarchaeota archaeon]|nr:carbon-nitrogen hydrolase family protein [Candidatus Bathyarchaeota archaeon]
MRVNKLRVAAAQINPILMDIKGNLNKIEYFAEKAVKEESAKLIVFPECALTGYVFSNIKEVKKIAESIPGSSTKRLEEICKRLKCWLIVGLVEKSYKYYYNAALLISPNGVEYKYRKAHLPYLGLDRFINKGNMSIQPVNTSIGKLGLAICYDIFFPEVTRVLALMGAELLAIPANWAEGVEFYTDYLIQARAIENHINIIAVNRVGEEKEFKFYGKSMIIDCSGKVLAKSDGKEEVIVAEVDLNKARNKHIVRIPGLWEVDCFKDRRSKLYKIICSNTKKIKPA